MCLLPHFRLSRPISLLSSVLSFNYVVIQKRKRDTEGRKMRGWGTKLVHMAYKFAAKKNYTDCNYIGGILLSTVFSAAANPGPTNLKTMEKWKTF